MTAAGLDDLTQRLRSEVVRAGRRIAAVYYCTHRREEGRPCRKRNPGLLWDAQREYQLILQDTFMIRDSEIDACAAHGARCRFIRLAEPTKIGGAERGRQHAFAEVPDLLSAVPYIMEHAAAGVMVT